MIRSTYTTADGPISVDLSPTVRENPDATLSDVIDVFSARVKDARTLTEKAGEILSKIEGSTRGSAISRPKDIRTGMAGVLDGHSQELRDAHEEAMNLLLSILSKL